MIAEAEVLTEEAPLEEILDDPTAEPWQWLPGTRVYGRYLNQTEKSQHPRYKNYTFPRLEDIRADLLELDQLTIDEKGRYVVVPDDDIGFYDDDATIKKREETKSLSEVERELFEEEALNKRIERADARWTKRAIYFTELAKLVHEGQALDEAEMEEFFKFVLKSVTAPSIKPNQQLFSKKSDGKNKYVIRNVRKENKLLHGEFYENEAPDAKAEATQSATHASEKITPDKPFVYPVPVPVAKAPQSDQKASQSHQSEMSNGGAPDYEWLTREVRRQKEAARDDANNSIHLIEAHLIKMMGDYDRQAYEFAGEADALDQLMRQGYMNQNFDWAEISRTAEELNTRNSAPAAVAEEEPASTTEEPAIIPADEVKPAQQKDLVLVTISDGVAPVFSLPPLQQILDRMAGKNPYPHLNIVTAVHNPDTVDTVKEETLVQTQSGHHYLPFEEIEPQPAQTSMTGTPIAKEKKVDNGFNAGLRKAAVVVGLFAASLSFLKFGDNKKDIVTPVQNKTAAAAPVIAQSQNTVHLTAVKKHKKHSPKHETAVQMAMNNADTTQNISYTPTAEDYLGTSATADTTQQAAENVSAMPELQRIEIRKDFRSSFDSIKISAPPVIDIHLPEIKNNFEQEHQKKAGFFTRLFSGKHRQKQHQPTGL
jgi:predicted  nucleic acid-binding Zn-ribbon protein